MLRFSCTVKQSRAFFIITFYSLFSSPISLMLEASLFLHRASGKKEQTLAYLPERLYWLPEGHNKQEKLSHKQFIASDK